MFGFLLNESNVTIRKKGDFMKIDLNTDPRMKFIFIAMMKAAIELRSYGCDREKFIEFAQGIWESMELNNEEELKETLNSIMKEDVDKYLKTREKENGK